jgi:hypothetical protein
MNVIKPLAKHLYDLFIGWLFDFTLFVQIIWLTYFVKTRHSVYNVAKTKDVIQEDRYSRQPCYKNRKKAEWVISEVIRIKAFHRLCCMNKTQAKKHYLQGI